MKSNLLNISYTHYKGGVCTNEDYDELHNFLVDIHNEQYTYARFDWMMTNREYLDRIIGALTDSYKLFSVEEGIYNLISEK